MAKTKISEFSSTPGNNTDIDSINIAEGCAPSGINNAIRELMAQLKDFQTGAVGDSFNGPVGTITAAAGAFTTLSSSGAANLSSLSVGGTANLSGATTISDLAISNIKLGYATTATAAGTTTLTAASPNQQFFTGSTTQTVVLPVTSTLALGLGYTITNKSTGVVTVQSSGLNTIIAIPSQATVTVTCILTSGTTAASWSYSFDGSANIPYKSFESISASVGSNALTVTLSPCTLDFRSSTLASGAVLTRLVPAAISMTVSSGSTLGTSSAVQSKLAVLAIDNAGTVELAIVNSSVYGPFDEGLLINTTAEGGAGGADSGSVIYSTSARTSVAFRLVGYIYSTQSTAGTWATSPSNISVSGAEDVFNATTATKLSTSFGFAPSYAARAWVNFNGTGTVAVVNSANVSSITDNGTGDYTVNFAVSMLDANYSISGSCGNADTSVSIFQSAYASAPTAGACRVFTQGGFSGVDRAHVSVTIYR